MTAFELPHSRTSAATARRELQHDLVEAGIADAVVADAVLVVSELVGNAVVHGRPLPDGAIRVEWQPHGGSVEISITDGGGATRPRRRTVDVTAPAGRGLAIIAELAAQWGVTQHHGRSTVWAVVGKD